MYELHNRAKVSVPLLKVSQVADFVELEQQILKFSCLHILKSEAHSLLVPLQSEYCRASSCILASQEGEESTD